jgi:hypothetical protein
MLYFFPFWYVVPRKIWQPCSTYAGLPDGLFSNQKSQIGKNFQGLGLENVDTFYGHLEYFIAIRDIV